MGSLLLVVETMRLAMVIWSPALTPGNRWKRVPRGGFDQAHALRNALALLISFEPWRSLSSRSSLNDFGRVEELDEPGPVGVERHVVGLAVGVGLVGLELLLGQGRGDIVAGVQPGQRADPVPAVRLAQGAEIGELHVAPGPGLLADVLEVVLVVDVVEDLAALGVDGPENAVIEVEGAVLADEAEVVRGERGEAVDGRPCSSGGSP